MIVPPSQVSSIVLSRVKYIVIVPPSQPTLTGYEPCALGTLQSPHQAKLASSLSAFLQANPARFRTFLGSSEPVFRALSNGATIEGFRPAVPEIFAFFQHTPFSPISKYLPNHFLYSHNLFTTRKPILRSARTCKSERLGPCVVVLPSKHRFFAFWTYLTQFSTKPRHSRVVLDRF